MRLYHFTNFFWLKNGGTILTEGLKPQANDLSPDLAGRWPVGVVWFTTESDPVMWWEGGGISQCRITVVIPTTDKRLMRWETWMRNHLSADELAKVVSVVSEAAWRTWYIYFGVVPLTRFRTVEYADPQKRAAMKAGGDPPV